MNKKAVSIIMCLCIMLTGCSNNSSMDDKKIPSGLASDSISELISDILDRESGGVSGTQSDNSLDSGASTGSLSGRSTSNGSSLRGTSGSASHLSSDQGTSSSVIDTGDNLNLFFPQHGGYMTSGTPTFRWSRPKNTIRYEFTLQKYNGKSFVGISSKKDLKTESFISPVALSAGDTYRYKVTAITGNGKKIETHDNNEDGWAVFQIVESPKNHPANKNLDFNFDGSVSEKVLKNYLSRSVVFSFFSTSATTPNPASDVRFILNTGAKYIGRSMVSWTPGNNEQMALSGYEEVKNVIEEVHKVDPDVVFEGTVFECIGKTVSDFTIPKYVFEAFGEKYVNRKFSYEKMLFPSGLYKDQWGTDFSVPDITRLETQMFFYYRATMQIDLGFEGIHFGQVHLIGSTDSGFKCWTDVLNKIREYAKKNARRHFVFLNAHTKGIIGSDGLLLFDFHAWPTRIEAEPGSVRHLPTKDNPQKSIIGSQTFDSIIGKSLGGKTHSGWSCGSLPYFVELDNYTAPESINTANTPFTGPLWVWGFDECSWFANQPESYRHQWIEYAYKKVQSEDPQGFFEMLGSRVVSLCDSSGSYITSNTYYANSSMFSGSRCWNDEETIKSVWINTKK